ncbi:MAG: FprA family A-type flavoprotein [Planctomycetota bacterium]|nr:MAG: FprA family A-type flavoprotein [Planctomycetota bacterium]
MSEVFKARRITDNVYWVGAVDWSIRDFHGYLTSRGTTYNAFLVMGEKTTLIDAVKKPFGEELLARIASVVEPERIDYVVSNHAEPDHTGALPYVLERVKPEKVFASKMGAKALAEHYGLDGVTAVENGGKLDIGGLTLSFMETRMLHWPDSMFTILEEERLLFSQDAFGMHLAGLELFADEIERSVLECEGAKYYANILTPYSKLVAALLAKVKAAGLAFDVVAPDHGPIYRTPEDIEWVLGAYERWAAQRPAPRAAVVYDSMWGSTDRMARAIAEGLTASGVEAKVMALGACHRSDVATEVLESGALVVGSPTLNNNLFPTVADVMSYLKGLKFSNLVGAAFGSYGWSGESVKQVAALLDEMGVEQAAPPLAVKYVPAEADLKACRELGSKVAKALLERTG